MKRRKFVKMGSLGSAGLVIGLDMLATASEKKDNHMIKLSVLRKTSPKHVAW